MLFNSLEFAIFLPIVFLLYWFVFQRNLKAQNLFVLIASYIFYGWWDYRLLGLIVISSLVDYIIGPLIYKATGKRKRKGLLLISLAVNLGLLGFFKYFNFFVDSFLKAFSFLGADFSAASLNIVLPVGISFYTFQTLSYSIDIYRKKLEPSKDAVAFFVFVSFFPQLVAGPIERARNLLPQCQKRRMFDLEKAKDGMRQILWGFFKKMVVADNCGVAVKEIFGNADHLDASTLLLGLMLFAVQVYSDFAGYSDIAIGTARLLGFQLTRNFANPFFAKSIPELWSRWHITMTTWCRDYLNYALGGSGFNKWVKFRNILIIFTAIGLWHGANWTFIIWGFIQGMYFIPQTFFRKRERRESGKLTSIIKAARTFFVFSITGALFGLPSVERVVNYYYNMLNFSMFQPPEYTSNLLWLFILFTLEWLQRYKQHVMDIKNLPIVARWIAYLVLAWCIALFGCFGEQEFIYFQF